MFCIIGSMTLEAAEKMRIHSLPAISLFQSSVPEYRRPPNSWTVYYRQDISQFHVGMEPMRSFVITKLHSFAQPWRVAWPMTRELMPQTDRSPLIPAGAVWKELTLCSRAPPGKVAKMRNLCLLRSVFGSEVKWCGSLVNRCFRSAAHTSGITKKKSEKVSAITKQFWKVSVITKKFWKSFGYYKKFWEVSAITKKIWKVSDITKKFW